MNRLFRLSSAIALAAMTATVTIPAISASASAATLSGGFDVGPGGFQGNFNPLAATGGFTWLSIYYEPLVSYDEKLQKVVGVLASSYEVSADQRSYTFTLTDAKWHDGQAFTAKDAKFTIELAKNPKTGSVLAARLTAVSSIETPDDKTLVVKLSTPSASLMDTMTKIMMLPEHALSQIPTDQLAKNSWWSTAPIGTGPFKFTRYVADQYVELSANTDYRGGKPALEKLIDRYFADPAAAISALRAGEIQFTYVDSNDVSTFKGNADFRVIEGESFVVNYLGFNHDSPIWKDLRVRQAVMYAINRPAIVQSLYGGAAKQANCTYVADHLVPKDVEPYGYDPEKARQLLKEAGWDKINGDKPITLLTYYTTPLAANVMAALQAMLTQVGINVTPRAVDTPTFNSIVLNPKPDVAQFQMIYAGLQNGPDPSSINAGLNEKQIPPAGANVVRARMPDLTTALDAALGETDLTKRNTRYQDVCKVINGELPWATLWVANRYGVVSSKAKDFVWTPAPGGGPYQAHPEKWSLAE
ncbi:ABC transporter substrate-binding protein [Agrobacterium sp. SHOUNA12C]|uniref:Oligopeptide ABC transporter n=2 Tax=Rhizobium rhizogenes TaxID=359 RepID=B9JLK3_RHIR8|nr:ABC transporter substrate-binding protein [Rhizobium rhizogenes]ACM30739.1 oligopeptide ABC transporter [Rhizobium rhizogenes K84]MCJ9721075.1 ABC transporter substrate-binding protein [Agrobacterium sp. BETTINA12B]MCJ9755832.1 ABC transporter substrate-binding protein [Agrobacterium sp. SHOUNA12C]OCJ16078.1 peptide ABC transporter substrate-binding protein [Agrobacterium sp. B131/95]OCJ19190.1 peptide ABC transporter substrate-binding protein [Agrobacterium sp. B133/95]